MKDSYIAKEVAEKLASMETLPLFASYHQAHLDGKSLKEWLYSQPSELLVEYAEATLFPDDENDTENQTVTEDLLATAIILKASVTNNKPIAEKDVARETGFLQILLSVISINKEVQEKWKKDIEVVIINNCTWEGYDKMRFQADPRVKYKVKR